MCTEKDLLKDSDDDLSKSHIPKIFPDLPLDAELSDITPDVLAAVAKRVAEYRKRYPQGEPMYKKAPTWRLFIYPEDIMLMWGKSLRGAQRALQNTRFVLEKKLNSDVTVTEFCKANDLNEEHVRVFLNKLDEARANGH